MITTGVKEARKRLSKYLNMVLKGEEIIITRRDEPIAKLVPVGRSKDGVLGSHADLRAKIQARGQSLSEIVIESREERL